MYSSAGMQQLAQVIKGMISISENEIDGLLQQCFTKEFKRNEILSVPDVVPNEIYFISEGIVRVIVTDQEGTQHTIYFAAENSFIADYSCFILKQPSLYSLQAIEATKAIVLPRKAIEWGYANLTQGDKLGRLVAESYFIYHDNFIQNLYARTPKERYDTIVNTFPNIHNRVPQHMIASYLGITSVHLSRLKKAAIKKT